MTTPSGSADLSKEHGKRRTRRASHLRSGLILTTLGVLLGSVNALSNYGHLPQSAYLSKVVGNDWAWLTLGYLSARSSGSGFKGSFHRALLALIPAVITYYTWDLPLMRQSAPEVMVPIAGFVLETIIWLAVATVTAGGLALIASFARREGPVGTVADMLVPSFIAWTAYRSHQFQTRIPQGSDPVLREVTGILWPIALGVAVCIGLAGFIIRFRSPEGPKRRIPAAQRSTR